MASIQEHLWYTRRHGRVRGPFPQQQITHYILLGRIRADDELSTDQENWASAQSLPHLIPEEMKNVASEEDRHRLYLARLRADERRGGDRRCERMENDEACRRAGDRRREEDSAVVRRREARRVLLEEARSQQRQPCGEMCRRLLIAVVAVGLLFVLFTPETPVSHIDCDAAPAPQVDWSNCRLPGLVAEHADLRGAQARNMDLTGARLLGAALNGADLAYSQLNLADLRRVDFTAARLTGAGLRAADLRGARLTGADLSYADLRDARVDGAELTGARLDNSLWFDGRTCQAGSVGACQ
ncbi:MAG: pentapeptide repeat-containing protein [Thiohalobacteraceae bacterium]